MWNKKCIWESELTDYKSKFHINDASWQQDIHQKEFKRKKDSNLNLKIKVLYEINKLLIIKCINKCSRENN